ncbi:MAG: hypothetical protein BWZ10_01851 [candidate division BRC1 bacterium ADurb.BinA364]|nr:MAG: hypothetical protein BWZ10_01851 [candidate division BRC1 bacterium ADurb.BinA364]
MNPKFLNRVCLQALLAAAMLLSSCKKQENNPPRADRPPAPQPPQLAFSLGVSDTGMDLIDSSPNAHAVKNAGVRLSTTERYSPSFLFSSAESAKALIDSSFVSDFQDFSICMRICPSSADLSDQSVYTELNSASYRTLFQIAVLQRDGGVKFHVFARDADGKALLEMTSPQAYPHDAWQDLLLIAKSRTVSLYIGDASAAAQANAAYSNAFATDSAALGALHREPSIAFFDGMIADFRIYNYAIDPAIYLSPQAAQ